MARVGGDRAPHDPWRDLGTSIPCPSPPTT